MLLRGLLVPRPSPRLRRTMREAAAADPSVVLSTLQQSRLGLTPEQYRVKALEAEAARAAYTVAFSDASLSNEARHNLEANFHLRWGRAAFKCPGCWLLPGLCVCAQLSRVDAAPHRVACLVHHKEAGRGSNTGILLAKCLGATLHVSGITDHEAALHQALAAAPAAAVLWPGEGALTVEEFKASLPPGAFEAGVTLVAVDATWNGARKMVKRLPQHVPRITLPEGAFPPGKSLLYPVRKYGGVDEQAERQCTYEAVVATLDVFCALKPGERDALLLNLKRKVDALLKYKNRRTCYHVETGIFNHIKPPLPDGSDSS